MSTAFFFKAPNYGDSRAPFVSLLEDLELIVVHAQKF